MNQQQIIEDIQAHVKKEADSITQQKVMSLVQRRKSMEQNLASITAEADAKIAEEENRINSRWARHILQEERRVNLALQDRVVRTVNDRAWSRLKILRENPEYSEFLRDWIIEAAIGLGYGLDSGGQQAEARIRCSRKDRNLIQIDLSEIQERFLALTNRPINLGFDKEVLPPDSIGIILIDAAGRIAYSNTLTDRFRRASQDIHRLVMERIFPGSSE